MVWCVSCVTRWCGGVASLQPRPDSGVPLRAEVCQAATHLLRARDHLGLLPRTEGGRIILGGSSICGYQLENKDKTLNILSIDIGHVRSEKLLPHVATFNMLRAQLQVCKKCEDDLRPLLPRQVKKA